MKNKKVLLTVTFFIYVVFMLWMTLFKREPREDRKILLDLFWAFRAWISDQKRGQEEAIQYLKNVLFYIPFGFMFPLKKKGWKVLLVSALGLSVTVELFQYVFKLGWCELDDIVSNCLGAFIGYESFRLVVCCKIIEEE